MKKLIVAIALVASATCVNAMSVDWQYTGVKGQTDYDVYMILGSTAKSTWESVADVAAASLGQTAKVTKNGTTYAATGKLVGNESVTKTSADYYYVLVNGNSYQVSSVIDGTPYVYDPDNKETSPGFQVTKNAAAGWSEAKTFSGGPTPPGPDPIPEPTSAMLILLGVAGLALRRRA